ncbi:MAG: type IV pilus biogenesis/stability protein PilW [Rhodocyclaceae bacterium]|nr:type IV pilus biogenesis/stability protein PilW [Rhodocyclaceae bacterium]
MKRANLVLLAAFVAGCAGSPSRQSASELPVSEQTTMGDAQARAKAHSELGMAYFQAGNMGVALQEARVAIESDPGYAPAYNLLGLVHMSLQENAQALSNFERASRLAPGDPDIANNYGLFLCQNGREQEGIREFLTAVKNALYKTPTRSYTNAGLCSLRLKDDKAAEEYFQRAAMADGSNAQAIFHLADIAYRRGNYFNAKNYIAEVHRLNEPNAESLWLALRIERKIGDRQAEAGFSSQLRRKFAGTPQHQALMQGKYE